MSVQTRSDECRDRAIEHIKGASAEIATILLEQSQFGHDDFSPEYFHKLGVSLQELIAIKNRLT